MSSSAKQNSSARLARDHGVRERKESIWEYPSSEEKMKASKEALLEMALNFDSLDFKSCPCPNSAVEIKYIFSKKTATFFIACRLKGLKCPCSRAVDFTWDLNLMNDMAKGKMKLKILEEISPMQRILYEDYSGFKKPMGPLLSPRDAVLIYNREDCDNTSIVWQHSVKTPSAPEKPGFVRMQTLVAGSVAAKLSESTCDLILLSESTMGGGFESKTFKSLMQCCGCFDTMGATVAKDFAQTMCDIKEFVDTEARHK